MSDTTDQPGQGRPLTAETIAELRRRLKILGNLAGSTDRDAYTLLGYCEGDFKEALRNNASALLDAAERLPVVEAERDRHFRDLVESTRECASQGTMRIIAEAERDQARILCRPFADALAEMELADGEVPDDAVMWRGQYSAPITAGEIRAALGITETVHEQIERDGTL